MFEKVPKNNFLIVSAFTRAAPLAGHLINALLFQSILRKMSPNAYTYMVLVAEIAILMIAVIFLNFKREQPASVSLKSAPSDMITQAQTAFSNNFVVFYSIWYIFGFGIVYQLLISMEDFMFSMHASENNVSALKEIVNASLNGLINKFECFVHKIDDLAWFLHGDCIGIEHILCSDVSSTDIHHSTETKHPHLSGRSVVLYKCINFCDR